MNVAWRRPAKTTRAAMNTERASSVAMASVGGRKRDRVCPRRHPVNLGHHEGANVLAEIEAGGGVVNVH
eukprot:3729255-Heterocapsa_arctica.AAC.1